MAGRVGKIVILSLLVLVVLSPGASGALITVGNYPESNYSALDLALQAAQPGDTIQFNVMDYTNEINSTMTPGNLTIFDKDLKYENKYGVFASAYATIRVNNTIIFKNTSMFNSTAAYSLIFWYDSATGGTFLNNSLVQFLGSTVLYNTSASPGTIVVNATGWTGTAINVTSSGNAIDLSYYGIGTHIFGTPSIGFNISGNNNYINEHYLVTLNSSGIGYNIVGDDNSIYLNTNRITAPLGRVYIRPGATGNTIYDSIANTLRYTVYNGTAIRQNYFGYFYNNSWSPGGGNMNPTINVTGMPYAGNVSIRAGFDNVTGSGNTEINGSLAVGTDGMVLGFIFNDTSAVVFRNMVSEVPLKYTFGPNTMINRTTSVSYTNELPFGSVSIVSFNPINSITTMSLNATRTTNWALYDDFTAVKPSFVVDNGSVDYRLLGNLTFAENIDLLNTTTINQLQELADGIVVTNDSISLNSTALSQFNKKAVLTMYPSFNFTTTADLILNVTPDGGAETTLWNGSAFNSQGYLTADTILVNTTGDQNSTTIWTDHFSNYVFSRYIAPPTPTPTPTATPTTAPTSSPGGSSSSGGGSGSSNIGVGVASGLQAGDTAGFSIKKTSIFEVTATVNKNVPEMMITVEKKTSPGSLEKPSVDVYQYYKIDTYRVDNSDISKGTIEFKVEASWLTENGYSYNDVVMIRYNEESAAWEQLPTELIGKDDGNYIYRATTPGFSWFAIGLEEGATIIGEEISKEIEIIVEEEQDPDMLKNGAEETEIPVQTTPEAPLEAAPFAALVFAGIALFLKRKK